MDEEGKKRERDEKNENRDLQVESRLGVAVCLCCCLTILILISNSCLTHKTLAFGRIGISGGDGLEEKLQVSVWPSTPCLCTHPLISVFYFYSLWIISINNPSANLKQRGSNPRSSNPNHHDFYSFSPFYFNFYCQSG